MQRQPADLHAHRAAGARAGIPRHAGRGRGERDRPQAAARHVLQVRHGRLPAGDQHPAGARRDRRDRGRRPSPSRSTGPSCRLTGTDDQASLPQPLVITPTVTGKGEWINTSTLPVHARATGWPRPRTYSVTVKAGLEDTTGGVLAEPYTFAFRTTDPTIVRWTPENNLTLRIEKPISVTFSMPMDKPSTEAAFSLTDAGRQASRGHVQLERGRDRAGLQADRRCSSSARATRPRSHERTGRQRAGHAARQPASSPMRSDRAAAQGA